MVKRKIISDKIWKNIKSKVDAGWKLVDISKEYRGRVTPAQISARKKKWAMDGYKSGSDRWAKYQTPEYKQWRAAVLKRDGYKCIICLRGKPAVKILQADHIFSWSKYPDKRFDVDNGRTLCVYHHKRTLNYGRRALFCDDEKNGKAWEIKERLLWNKRQEDKDKKGLNKLRRNTGTITKVKEKVRLLQQRFSDRKR